MERATDLARFLLGLNGGLEIPHGAELLDDATQSHSRGKPRQGESTPPVVAVQEIGLRNGGEQHALEDAVKPYQLIHFVLDRQALLPLAINPLGTQGVLGTPKLQSLLVAPRRFDPQEVLDLGPRDNLLVPAVGICVRYGHGYFAITDTATARHQLLLLGL